MKEYKTPVIAIIGRPNVGKSTLFNALVGERRSIVSPIAGTTRDSLMEKINNLGVIPYWIVDTAGLTDFTENDLEKEIQIQVEVSLKNADIILWLVDGKEELTQEDRDIAQKLRIEGQKVLFCANKIDDGNEQKVYAMAELGFGLPQIISAKSNFGFWDMVETIQNKLKELKFEAPEAVEEILEEDEEGNPKEKPLGEIKVALIGRPNVGKSTLFNKIIGQERSVVSDVAGTTRDSIDTQYKDEEGQEYMFIDTAGVRKRGKIEKNFEYWSYVRTNQSIERADVCVILFDALDGVTHQDLVLAGKAVQSGAAIILAVNKFDLAVEKSRAKTESDERELEEVPMWDEDVAGIRDRYLNYLHKKIGFLPWAPVLFFSGKTGKGVQDIFASIKGAAFERNRRVGTRELNLYLKDIFYGHVPPCKGTKMGKMKYVSQVATQPPKFLFFVNNTEAFHFSYIRYIENKLRKKYGFMGTPVQVELRDSMSARKKWEGKTIDPIAGENLEHKKTGKTRGK